jgi:hypothetical protein
MQLCFLCDSLSDLKHLLFIEQQACRVLVDESIRRWYLAGACVLLILKFYSLSAYSTGVGIWSWHSFVVVLHQLIT